MTAPVFGAPRPQYRRAMNGRPYVMGPDGKERTYSRVTTFIGCLEDTSTLTKWKQRQTLIGASKSPGLIKSVKAAAATDDKNTLNDLAEKAMTLAGAGDKAEEGTANHSLTELIDTGQPLPDGLDELTLRDMEAYRLGTAGLTVRNIETSVANHELLTAGTFDREVFVEDGFGWPSWLVGRIVLDDLKTGRVDYGLAKMDMQLGLYSRSDRYDIATGVSSPLGVDQTVGLIVHLPAGQGRCDVYALDLAFGWASVLLAKQVRDWRSAARKSADFSTLVKSIDLATGVAA